MTNINFVEMPPLLIPQTMRAVRYDQPTKHLSLVNIPVPSPSKQEYLIKVSAAAITSGELIWTRPAGADPFTPCVEFAGVIAIAPDPETSDQETKYTCDSNSLTQVSLKGTGARSAVAET